jgi:glycine cleavage system H lipoate-binding protein
MEGFKYVDIFATKGLEYIVAIAFLIMLIWFWKWLNNPSVSTGLKSSTPPKRIKLVDWFFLENKYYYHQGHSWIYPENKDSVNMGIDDFAQKLVGKPTDIYLPSVGTELKQGENAFKVEIEGKWIEFLSPVDGKVIALNKDVMRSPDIINHDPYHQGWLLKVKPERLVANLKNLLHGNIARAWIEQTVNQLSRIITRNYGIVMQDGGTITNGFVKELAPDNWEQVAAVFFLTKDVEI